MSVIELAVLYAVVGVGCAAAYAFRSRARVLSRAGESMLLVTLWPLYAPFVLTRQEMPAAGAASASPLSELLPDDDAVARLEQRLAVARTRVADIERVLARPEFAEQPARERLDKLHERNASSYAISSAQLRLANIGRMRELKNRFQRELDEVGELLQQLTTQAEVVRLVGEVDGDTEELVRELLSRVEGLDAMLDDPSVLHA